MFGFSLEKTWQKFIAFGFVGVGAFVIDWLVFNGSYFVTKMFALSVAIGWVISMIFNFTMNRNFTFKARGEGHSRMSKQIAKWVIVYFFGFLTKVIAGELVLMFVKETAFTANIAYFTGEIAMVPVTFFGSLLWAFKKKK